MGVRLSSVATLASTRTTFRDYAPRGAQRELFHRHDRQILLCGPAGTGKSRGCLEKLHLCALKYDGMRAVMLRKTRTSLTQTGMVTFKHDVDYAIDDVAFHVQDQEYRYPNGSVIIVGGLDDPKKIMSGQYDMAYVQEATDLFEDDWESLDTRLRNNVLPYQQLIADCNPDVPTHWLKQRCEAGKTVMLESRHEDNPTVTPEYLAALDNLTGVRYLRLRLGIWAAAEGLVYEGFTTKAHLLDRFEIPESWRRIRVVDFGYTNPFVCQWWAIDPDGRAYLYRELYRTQTIVSDHAIEIKRLSAGEKIERTIADHDAEDRATLASCGIPTQNAVKMVGPGIQAVQQRLRVLKDGKPRLFILRDSLVARDEALAARKKPLCTEQEIAGYVWTKSQDGRPLKEEPVKLDDHGMDAMRYLVAYLDGVGGPLGMEIGPKIYS